MKHIIRPLKEADVALAMEMVWNVFAEFIAPDFEQEGIDEFKRFINPQAISDKITSGEFKLWGAFVDGAPVGVIAIGPPLRVALFSVNKQYHRRGIGRELFETAMSDKVIHGHSKITVNASPYAVDIYQRLGFVPTSAQQAVNGIKFTPMVCRLV
jgi:Predicted acetyltransferase